MRRFVLRLRRKWKITKREKFALITGVLTLGLVATQLVGTEERLKMVGVLFLATYVLSAWGLADGLSGIEWFTLLILPSFYTTAVALFYFLLPVRWLTRLPVASIYALGMYALLLIGNIYNVAMERSIQLVRAAHAIGLLLSVLTAFLILSTIYSLHLPAFSNFFLVFILFLPLTYQQLWVMTLESRMSVRLMLYTVSIALNTAFIGLVLSFWPVQGIITSLFLATLLYCSIGMTQQYIIERLFPATARTFVIAVGFVFLILIMTTQGNG